MTDPRNYMKALEGLPKTFQWSVERDGCHIENYKLVSVTADTVFQALAAIYDAEQKERDEKSRPTAL